MGRAVGISNTPRRSGVLWEQDLVTQHLCSRLPGTKALQAQEQPQPFLNSGRRPCCPAWQLFPSLQTSGFPLPQIPLPSPHGAYGHADRGLPRGPPTLGILANFPKRVSLMLVISRNSIS